MNPIATARGRGMRVVLLAMALAVVVSCVAVLLAFAKTAEAAFPGKNGSIAFASDRETDYEIYKMLPDGSKQKQITFNTTNDTRPAWSADGTKIVFERYGRVFVKDIRTGQTVRLIDSGECPAWSPDGTKVVFCEYRDGDQEIYTVNSSDGSGERQLTDNQNYDVFPAWSPDGTTIAFQRDGDIWVMDPDGADQKNLTNTPELSESGPDWSPDGTRIAFQNWGGDLGFQTDIFSIKVDGSGLVNLTNTPEVSEDYPTWAPNGRKIAYSVGFSEIWKMNADGSQQENLTNTPETSEFLPDWQSVPAPSG